MAVHGTVGSGRNVPLHRLGHHRSEREDPRGSHVCCAGRALREQPNRRWSKDNNRWRSARSSSSRDHQLTWPPCTCSRTSHIRSNQLFCRYRPHLAVFAGRDAADAGCRPRLAYLLCIRPAPDLPAAERLRGQKKAYGKVRYMNYLKLDVG
jgi:hypothetical protein